MALRRLLLSIIALTLAVGAFARAPDAAWGQTKASADPAASLLEDARGELARERYARAADLLRRALDADPADAAIASMLREACDAGGLKPTVDESHLDALTPFLGQGFRRTETNRFVILSDAPTKWTRERERLLERTYHELMKFATRVGLPAVPPEHKMVVVLFGNHADYRRFALTHDGVEAGWVAGYYASVPNHAVFYDDRTSPAFLDAHALIDEVEREAADARRVSHGRNHPAPESVARRATDLEQHAKHQRERLLEQAEKASLAKTTHEATHLIAFNTNIQLRSRHYPFWITEGLAIAFETEDPDRAFGPQIDQESRQRELDALAENRALVPLAEFVQRTEAHANHARAVREEYTQAWSLFRDAARYRTEELVGLFADIARSPAGRMSPAQQSHLFEQRFGDPSDHERAWLRRR